MKFPGRLILFMCYSTILVSLIIMSQDSKAEQRTAKPGDLVIRHGEGILGPPVWFDNIPHVGIYIGDNEQLKANVVELTIEKKDGKSFGVIKTTNWTNEDRFKDAGFFSILESDIPIRYQGKEMSFRELPEGTKNLIREAVCRKAVSEVGKNKGEFFATEYTRVEQQTSRKVVEPSNNCGDWVAIDIYGKVLKDIGIQVLRGKKGNFREVELVDYFRNPFIKTKTCDPSLANDYFQRMAPPSASPSGDRFINAGIPNYWTTGGEAKSLTEAEVMTAFARGKKRVLVVGSGPEAAHLYQRLVAMLGQDNVKWVQDERNWVQEAAAFGAEVVLGVRQVKTDDKRAKKAKKKEEEKRDYPGGPDPPDGGGGGGGQAMRAAPHFSGGGGNQHPPPPPPQPPKSPPLYPEGGNIGGVMLAQAAISQGSGPASLLSSGDFSLILTDPSGGVDVTTLRRFVTALWAVYFSQEGPGISIDPIAPGAERHLVRYIGRVINTDLGRVMREADYHMKQLAVGTIKPDLPGFRSVDALSYRHGLQWAGASRRFWFVPEGLTFSRVGSGIVWEAGSLRLKTEYLLSSLKGKAEPADEAFARFFTENYRNLSQRYPIYQELWEYTKLVSLAQYLKQQGVPLLWYLMANKELVLTEDSPGTVAALIKKSDYLEGIQIEGGVDLSWQPGQGQYLLDQAAVQAIQKAKLQNTGEGHRPSLLNRTITFKVKEKDYHLVSSQAISAGWGAAGGTGFYTDLVLRRKNLPILEMIRYYNPRLSEPGVFGRDWHLMVPYRIIANQDQGENSTSSVMVKNLVSGHGEELHFDGKRYPLAGFVPPEPKNSQVLGLFPRTDGSSCLVDKLGNEFWFNPAGRLTDMKLSPHYQIRFTYHHGLVPMATPFYRLEPDGPEQRVFQHLQVPVRLKVVHPEGGPSEILVLRELDGQWGYFPGDPSQSRFKRLSVMSDATFLLEDRQGWLFSFDQGGNFKGVFSIPEKPLVKSLATPEEEVILDYGLTPTLEVAVISARVWSRQDQKETYALIYIYNDQGTVKEVVTGDDMIVREHDGRSGKTFLACR